jgi:hypothetical protein
MNKEKLVVVLLLITIILSVISVIVTLSANTTGTQPTNVVKEKDSGSATVGFGVVLPTTGSAG